MSNHFRSCGTCLGLVLVAHAKSPTTPDDEAWAKLPAKSKKNPALPAWARMLAGPLPKTTARMLELDYLHGVENPLGAVLAAKIPFSISTG